LEFGHIHIAQSGRLFPKFGHGSAGGSCQTWARLNSLDDRGWTCPNVRLGEASDGNGNATEFAKVGGMPSAPGKCNNDGTDENDIILLAQFIYLFFHLSPSISILFFCLSKYCPKYI
jgi:hypothetical protein